VTTVHLYVGRDCHLCENARAELERLRAELGFEVEEVDITGDSDLERRYRELLPVIEIDGNRISVYRVDESKLRALV
jgi:glutaredoxin